MAKNTILVTSPAAGGKTYTLNLLRQIAQEWRLPYDPIPLSDAQTIVHHMREDDKHGGLNHYHPWTNKQIGHTHQDPELHPEFPFSLYGNVIGDAMLQDFFQRLNEIPDDGRLHFAEWAGGGNTNISTEPASTADLSFESAAKKLNNHFFNPDGLDRVLMVIHPYAGQRTREELNLLRTIPTEEQITYGTASWPLDNIGMNIFGQDDFHHCIPIFNELNIPVHHVKNTGNHELEGTVRTLIEPMFYEWQYTTTEGQSHGGRNHEQF